MSSASPTPAAVSLNTRLPSRAQVASRDSGQTMQPPATSEAAFVSAASRPATGYRCAAAPPLHRPAASGATGAVTAFGGVASIGNLNMLLSLRDLYICEADITSCEALLQCDPPIA